MSGATIRRAVFGAIGIAGGLLIGSAVANIVNWIAGGLS